MAITKIIDSIQGDNRNELTCCKEGKDRWRALEGGKLLPTWQLGLVIGVRRPAFLRRLWNKLVNGIFRCKQRQCNVIIRTFAGEQNIPKLQRTSVQRNNQNICWWCIMTKHAVVCFPQVSCYATYWYKEDCYFCVLHNFFWNIIWLRCDKIELKKVHILGLMYVLCMCTKCCVWP